MKTISHQPPSELSTPHAKPSGLKLLAKTNQAATFWKYDEVHRKTGDIAQKSRRASSNQTNGVGGHLLKV